MTWAFSFLADFEKRTIKPEYWARHNQKKLLHSRWLRQGLSSMVDDLRIGNLDPTRATTGYLFRSKLKHLQNRLSIRLIKPFTNPPANRTDPYFLFPLHKQPESSIDVLGDFYSNQSVLIENIVRSLPASHCLYVKEHSNAIGDRGQRFYSSVKRLPKVKLIDPAADSYALLDGATAVLTVSGTMAYEAALVGKPAVTFARMFFNALPSVYYCGGIRELPQILRGIVSAPANPPADPAAREKRAEFLAQVYRNSYEGIFSDVFNYPESLNENNIAKIVFAIDDVVRSERALWPGDISSGPALTSTHRCDARPKNRDVLKDSADTMARYPRVQS